ncbi:MAG: hypothetical protein Q8R02_15740 [Hyphomonadaceae bacterium]|nr:hypothetical protein [Hyphomonadaceae bacterium]
MTPAPSQNADQEKARRQMMTGVMLVMGACVFGGLTAVVLVALGQREAAGIVAVLAGLAIVVGVVVQVSGFRKMKALVQGGSK